MKIFIWFIFIRSRSRHFSYPYFMKKLWHKEVNLSKDTQDTQLLNCELAVEPLALDHYTMLLLHLKKLRLSAFTS